MSSRRGIRVRRIIDYVRPCRSSPERGSVTGRGASGRQGSNPDGTADRYTGTRANSADSAPSRVPLLREGPGWRPGADPERWAVHRQQIELVRPSPTRRRSPSRTSLFGGSGAQPRTCRGAQQQVATSGILRVSPPRRPTSDGRRRSPTAPPIAMRRMPPSYCAVATHWRCGRRGEPDRLRGAAGSGRDFVTRRASRGPRAGHVQTSPRRDNTMATSSRDGSDSDISPPAVTRSEAIGRAMIRRTEVRQFGDKQIELLRTFADQAVSPSRRAPLRGGAGRTRELTKPEFQTANKRLSRHCARERSQPVLDPIARARRPLCQPSTPLLQARADRLYIRRSQNADSPFAKMAARTIAKGRERPPYCALEVRRSISRRGSDPGSPSRGRSTLEGRTQLAGRSCGRRAIGVIFLRARGQAFTSGRVDLVTVFAEKDGHRHHNGRLFGRCSHEPANQRIPEQRRRPRDTRVINSSITTAGPSSSHRRNGIKRFARGGQHGVGTARMVRAAAVAEADPRRAPRHGGSVPLHSAPNHARRGHFSSSGR